MQMDKYMSPQEVAQALGYKNLCSVYNAARLGRIPKPVKHRNLLFFKRKDIEKHLKDKRK